MTWDANGTPVAHQRYRVVVRITREVEVEVNEESESRACDAALVIAKQSKSAHDVVMCDVAVVEGGQKTAA